MAKQARTNNMDRLISTYPELRGVFLKYDHSLSAKDVIPLLEDMSIELGASKQLRYGFLLKTIQVALSEYPGFNEYDIFEGLPDDDEHLHNE